MSAEEDDRQRHHGDAGFLARIDERVYNLKRALEELRAEMRREFDEFVRMSRFKPVEVLVYGLVTLILTAVVSALLAKVLAQ